MKTLLISGDTLQQTEWDIEDVLTNTLSKTDFITRLIDDEWMDKQSTCGLTYGQIRELNEYTLR
jgi:hypothetical protein